MYKDKQKGLPGTRGRWYLIAGIMIGVVISYAFFSLTNRPALPATPPSLVTPIMLGQSASHERPQLKGFSINDAQDQLILSYWDGESQRKSYPWLGTHIGLSPVVSLASPATPANAIRVLNSPDEAWQVVLNTEGAVEVQPLRGNGPKTTLRLEGIPYDFAFSPNNQMLAVLSKSKDEQTLYTEIFTLPALSRLQFYSSPIYSFTYPTARFNANGTQIAVVFSNRVILFSLIVSEERVFPIPNALVSNVAFDLSGNWLVVSTNDPYMKDYNGLYFYLLTETTHLPTTLPSVQFIPLENAGGLQFVEAGLLVASRHTGEYASDETWDISLYRRDGDTWGNPTVVLTEKDLQ